MLHLVDEGLDAVVARRPGVEAEEDAVRLLEHARPEAQGPLDVGVLAGVAVAARALTADRLDALRRRPPAEGLDPAREVERSDEQAAGRRVHGLGCGLGYWGGVEKGAAAVE